METMKDWPFWMEFLNLLLSPHMVITGAIIFILLKFRGGFKTLFAKFIESFNDGKTNIKVTVGAVSFETSERKHLQEPKDNPGVSQIENVGGAAKSITAVAAVTVASSIVDAEVSQHTADSVEKTKNPNVEILMEVDQSPVLLNEAEEQLKNVLLSNNLETDSDTARVLIRNLASSTINCIFEKDYSLVRGSEIQLLEKLNTITPTSMTLLTLNQHIAETRDNSPEFYTKFISVSDYMSWLLSNKLALETDTGFTITIRGAAFIRWIVVNNKPHKKYF